MNDARTDALELLYRLLKKARIHLYRTKQKLNSEQEIKNLEKKIRSLEWITEVVLRECDTCS